MANDNPAIPDRTIRPSNTPDQEPAVTLPFSAIRALIWGDDRLEEQRPLSKAPGDTAKVYVRSRVLGELLASIDTEERYLHVEFYDAPESFCSLGHAELWLSFEWRESNSRRTRFREVCDKERQEQAIFSARVAELMDEMKGSLPSAFKRQLAETLLKNLSKLDIVNDPGGVLTAMNSLDLLQRYAKENQSNTQQLPETQESNTNT